MGMQPAQAARTELIRQARRGDRAAFDTLASGIVDRLYSVARLILRDADRAEDATQETLVRCWRDLPSLRDPDRFDAWVHRLLLNAVHDEFRVHRRHEANVRILHVEPVSMDPSGEVATREQLARGFDRLSPDHRAVLVLRLYLGLSVEETADHLGIPAGTAKSRLHYATEAMRLALEADARLPGREVSA
jgi:RNA polymerase sigma-70 factor, ECF subfamily